MSSSNHVIIPTAYNRKDLVDMYWWKSEDVIHSVWITLICLSLKQNNVIKKKTYRWKPQFFSTYESVADLRRIKSKSNQVKTFHTSSFPIQYKNNISPSSRFIYCSWLCDILDIEGAKRHRALPWRMLSTAEMNQKIFSLRIYFKGHPKS